MNHPLAHSPLQAQSPLTLNQQALSLQQVLRYLHHAGKLQPVLSDIVGQYVLERELERRSDLVVTESDIAQAITQMRQAYALTDDSQFQAWLTAQRLDEHDLYQQTAFNLKLEQFKTQLAAPKLLEAFMDCKCDLDRVVLSRITVHSLDLAEELKLQIAEGADFAQLAQEYSITDDAVTHGMMGVLSRSEVQAAIGVDGFQHPEGALIGPLSWDEQWCLLRIERLLPACFDDAVQAELQQQLFEQWLIEQVQSIPIDIAIEPFC